MNSMTDYLRTQAMVQASCFKSNNPKGYRQFNYTSQ